MASRKTVLSCLVSLGISLSDLSVCASDDASVVREQEFSTIKKAYFKCVLSSHPDKGGDPALFREQQASWDIIRELKDKRKVHPTGFTFYFGAAGSSESRDQREAVFSPSWEYFQAASQEATPPYLVELAKSGRSECKADPKSAACKHGFAPQIEQGEIRFGSLVEETGTYSRFRHLKCFRVPAAIWLALPDPETCSDASLFKAAITSLQQVGMCGFTELPSESQDKVVAYFMDKSNYARLTKNSKAFNPNQMATTSYSSSSHAATYLNPSGPHSSSSQALVHPVSSSTFVLPRPGLQGAPEGCLAGKTFVLTGVFPEVGGGCGLELGKARVRGMIESFGGKVTGSVSGRTDFLCVGKAPGAVKVSQATTKNVPMVSVQNIKQCLEGGGGVASLSGVAPVQITSYSDGYRGSE